MEIENEKRAHIKDGVAMTKFIYWLKKNTGRIPMDEISVSDYLGKLRMDQEGCIGLSFATISAYGHMEPCAITLPHRRAASSGAQGTVSH